QRAWAGSRGWSRSPGSGGGLRHPLRVCADPHRYPASPHHGGSCTRPRSIVGRRSRGRRSGGAPVVRGGDRRATGGASRLQREADAVGKEKGDRFIFLTRRSSLPRRGGKNKSVPFLLTCCRSLRWRTRCT